ncbi:MAG: YitT family protein, partial [Phycisphaerae bacterium]
TRDSVLTAVFGGFFIGAGIGLAVRGNAVLDGTEVAALLISKRSSLFSVGDVILGFNVAIFLSALFVIGVEESLFSILTYVSAAKTLDFVLHGIDQYTSITIISQRSDAIRERITLELGRGVTVYKGQGGLSGADLNILCCVVTRLEIGKVRNIARDVDESAFVVYHPLSGAEGGRVTRSAMH